MTPPSLFSETGPAGPRAYPHLFQAGRIGCLELPNRIVKSPLACGMANMDGTVSDRLILHYRRIAAGGAGLAMVEYAYVHDAASKAAHGQLGIPTNEHIPGLASLADVIHWSGAKAGLQLVHAGSQRSLGHPIKAPTATAGPAFTADREKGVPEELTVAEIGEIVEAFGKAAARAVMAGYDLVEVHGAHGYLITNFLSSHTNRRTDAYGGELENRMRFLLEVLDSVRGNIPPETPLSLRLNGSDYEPDGITLDEAVETARAAVAHGVDAVHVSGGDHRTVAYMVAPMLVPHGQNVWAAEAVKRALDVPVIVVGSFTSPDHAEDVIAAGKADFVALGRALLADPEWVRKARDGRVDEIRPCIRCNDGCLDRTNLNFRAVTCSVNPRVGLEGVLDVGPSERPASVAVVGGGPAGLEAARVAAARGHRVTLFERRRLGGLLNEASEPTFKADLRPYLRWLVSGVKRAGVEITEREATAPDLADFDHVIVAVGSTPKGLAGGGTPATDGVGDGSTVERVVVVGGGGTGVEAAIRVAERGVEVTLVEQEAQIMRGEVFTDRTTYAGRLGELDVRILTSTRAERVTEDGVSVEDGEGRRTLRADRVLIAIGSEPDRALATELEALGITVHLIGDALIPGRIHDAVHSAQRIALRL